MKWSKDKQELVKMYLKQDYSYQEIAKAMKLRYDQIKHAIVRYSLKEGLTANTLFPKAKNKMKREDIVRLSQMIGKNLYDNYKAVKLKEPKSIKCKGKKEEMSILDISDMHIGMINEVFDSKQGKKVVTYNMEIFEKEMNILQNSIYDIHSILSHSYSLKELTIFSLGDIITNDRIFPEQSFEIEKVVGLQVWDGVNYITKFINNLLAIYENITFVGVVGNHGRSNPNHYNEPVQNNFEYFLYKILEKQFESSKRVKIIVPETRRYIHKIYDWKHMIEHGDNMRGSTSNAIEKQIKEIALNVGGFNIFHMGHYHKLLEREIGDSIIVKQNGCFIEKDSYGFAKFKTYSAPKQWFFGCNKTRPETWNFKISLKG